MPRVTLMQAMQKMIDKKTTPSFQDGLLTVRIRQIWVGILPQIILMHVTSMRLHNHVLIIKTNDGPTKDELLRLKNDIQNKINELLKSPVIQSIKIY
ncbi:MAG: DciA family protein [Phycisphaerales bacterium]|nr:DciA family protein [Phycisphaerales bacterium]